MNITRIPGNEPDSDDMATEPGAGVPHDGSKTHELPEEEADKLGNFA